MFPTSSGFAVTPTPPYYAVVFTSQRTSGDNHSYAEASGRMLELAAQQPGYLGVESTRGADGLGITVSYWQTLESIRAWRTHAEHLEAQAGGRNRWYSHYELRICRVERASSYDASSLEKSADG